MHLVDMPKSTQQSVPVVLGERLRAARLSASALQEDAADAVGVTINSIYYWESGKVAIKVEAMLALAHFYGVSPASLLEGL